MLNEQNRTEETLTAVPPTRRRWLPLAGLALVFAAGLGAGAYFLLRHAPTNGHAQNLAPDEPAQPAAAPAKFAGWGKPDLVLVVTGQMHGYVGPCGCSEPQYGGLTRRFNVVQSLKDKGWPVVGIDLGELAATKGIHQQNLLKLEYSLRALDLMGYRAYGLGRDEFVMPLLDALGQYSVNNPNPRPVATSLAETEKSGQLYHDLNVRPVAILEGTDPKVGVLNLTGPALADSFKGDKSVRFVDNLHVAVPKALARLADSKAELAVALLHDYPKPPDDPKDPRHNKRPEQLRHEQAGYLAKVWASRRAKDPSLPTLELAVVLAEDSEASFMLHPVAGTPTHVLEIGQKGKYVGVVGVYRQPGGGFALKYEPLLVGPEYDYKAGQANPVADLFEKYAEQVKKENLLAKAVRSPHPIQVDPYVKQKYGDSKFVDSETCADCHRQAYAIWEKTGHAHAYDTLVNAKHPSLRQFDAECITCHTVGFKHPGGFNELPRALTAELKEQGATAEALARRLTKHNKALLHVGCESCHGPAGAHVNNPDDVKLYPLINPYRPSARERDPKTPPATRKALFDQRMLRLDTNFCQKCHDQENDVHWTQVPFTHKWVGGGVIHNRPDNVGNQFLKGVAPKKGDNATHAEGK